MEDKNNNNGKEKTTQAGEVKSEALGEPIKKDGIGGQPDGEQPLADELRARLTPEEAAAVREKLLHRADTAFEKADFATAKALRDEADAIGQETSGGVGSGTVLLLLGAAALGLYVVSERQRQAQQAAAAAQAAAAMAAARQQSQDNHRGMV